MRLIVGMSGATGVEIGYYLLQTLRQFDDIETHLVVSENAAYNFEIEMGISMDKVLALADFVHDNKNFAASISSGSYYTDGMIIAPTSMKTLAGVVNGFSSNLLLRAADVCIKEGRKLVLVPREMPFSQIHLENMARAASYGCRIVVPVLTFYNDLPTTEQQVQHVIGKILMQFGLDSPSFVPWKGL